MPVKNEVGNKYGELVVLSYEGNTQGKVVWLCLCSCGNRAQVRGDHLRSGNTRSCGCVRSKAVSEANTKHGLHNHKIYNLWRNIHTRCRNGKIRGYKNYGGRGITVCSEWTEDFQVFYDWCVASGWKPGLQIDRINNNAGYEPGNCRFVTNYENSHNKRRLMVTNKTGYAGVYKRPDTGKFAASVQHLKKSYKLGCFDTAREACQARNEFIIKNNLPHRIQKI